MDNYVEQILDIKPSIKQRMKLIGAIAVILIGCFVLFFIDGNIGFTVIIVGGVLVYFAKLAQSIEYEYLFINGDFEVARIASKASRKKIYSFSTGDVQRILPYSSPKFQNELEVNAGLSVKDFTTGVKANNEHWYGFVVNDRGKTVAVLLELDSRTLEHVKTYYKMKIEL